MGVELRRFVNLSFTPQSGAIGLLGAYVASLFAVHQSQSGQRERQALNPCDEIQALKV